MSSSNSFPPSSHHKICVKRTEAGALSRCKHTQNTKRIKYATIKRSGARREWLEVAEIRVGVFEFGTIERLGYLLVSVHHLDLDQGKPSIFGRGAIGGGCNGLGT